MSHLRFCTTNHALGKTILGTRSERSSFVMEKALQRDILLPWISGATPASPFPYDIDLGSALSVECVGLLAYEPLAPAQVTTVNVYSATTYPTFTLRASFAIGSAKPRHSGTVIAAQSARYWRFEFVFTGGGTVGTISVGKFLLGPQVTLGFRQSGRFERNPVRYRTDGPKTIGGHPTTHDLGLKAQEWKIPFKLLTDASQAIVEALSDQTGTFAIFDPDDRFAEVLLRGSQFGRPFFNIYDGNIELEGLG